MERGMQGRAEAMAPGVEVEGYLQAPGVVPPLDTRFRPLTPARRRVERLARESGGTTASV